MYEPRLYRQNVDADGLVSFSVAVGESDLLVFADANLEQQTLQFVTSVRSQIQQHVRSRHEFLSSMEPLPMPAPEAGSCLPRVIATMYRAGKIAGTGPMAAVAGALAEAVGDSLLELSSQVIVENGGDIFIKSDQPRVVSIHAGQSPLSEKVGLAIPVGRFGVCTSSGTVGHSISFGNADAAMVVSADTALADAVATALGNRVCSGEDIAPALEWVKQIEGVLHAAIVFQDRFGTWGQFEIVPIGTSR